MYQIYLLSILTLLMSGVTLAHERLQSRAGIGSIFDAQALARPTFRLVLGVATLLVGFFQFLTVAPGDIPVVGDLVPAVTGLLVGGILILEYYQNRSTEESPLVETLGRVFVDNGSNFGIVGIVVAALHFLFNRVLFL